MSKADRSSRRVQRKRRASGASPAQPAAWLTQARYRMLAYCAAITVAAIATISVIGAPWLPVVGVAVAALAVSVSKATKGLGDRTCLGCGADLSEEPAGVHGVACPSCGAVNSPSLRHLARLDERMGERSDQA